MRNELYRKLTIELQRLLPAASRPQVKNLALLTQALVFSRDCRLPNLALELPIAGQRESLVQRLIRTLDNSHIEQRSHYLSLGGQLFAHWPDREITLVMDRTDIGQERSILLLAVAFGHRAIPLSWQVLPFGGTSEEKQIALLRQVQPYLPTGKRVLFLGDCEFRAVGLQGYCREQGWGWQVGVKSDTLFHTGDGQWRPLQSVSVAKGERRYLHQITLTQNHAFPTVHLLVDWTHNWKTPRYVVCHLPTNSTSWRRGRKRFWIEPTFRDWKSYGFDLEASHITDPQRLESLLLGMSLTTLWLLHVGHWLVLTGRVKWLMATHRRDYSLFRLGRDYARRCQLQEWYLPVRFHR